MCIWDPGVSFLTVKAVFNSNTPWFTHGVRVVSNVKLPSLINAEVISANIIFKLAGIGVVSTAKALPIAWPLW